MKNFVNGTKRFFIIALVFFFALSTVEPALASGAKGLIVEPNQTLAAGENSIFGSSIMPGSTGSLLKLSTHVGAAYTTQFTVDTAGVVTANQIKLITGAGNGKVLTSDANGLATWQAAAGGSQWTTSGSNIYFTGNIGIGTTNVSNWNTNFTGINIGGNSAIMADKAAAGADLRLFSNAYYDGAYKYIANGYATGMWLDSSAGTFDIQSAPSGSANGALSWTDLFHINNNGSVGIGTTVPGAKLDVVSANGGIRALSGAAGSYAYYSLGRTATDFSLGVAAAANQFAVGAGASDIILTTAGGKLLFDTNNGVGTPAMTILNSNGNIGIGTTDPSEALSVNGSVTYNDRMMTYLAASNAGSGRWAHFASFTINNAYENDHFEWVLKNRYYGGRLFLHLSSSNPPSYNYLNDFIYDGDYGGSPTLAIYHTSTYVWDVYIYEDGWSSTYYSQLFTNMTAGSSVGSVAYYSDSYSDPPGGYTSPAYNYFGANVGIGTTAPGGTLTVKAGNNGWDGGIDLISNDGSKTFEIHPENSAGYGLMFGSPGQGFYFDGGGGATQFFNSYLAINQQGNYSYPNPGSGALGAINLRMANSTYSTGITFSSASGNNAQAGIYVSNNNSDGTRMYLATTQSYATGPQSRVMIDNYGNVGIDNTSPAYALDVSGDIRANNGWLRTDGNAGWYSDTYGGGWYMSDSYWVRAYNGKAVYTSGELRTDGGFESGSISSAGAGTIQASSFIKTNSYLSVTGYNAGQIELNSSGTYYGNISNPSAQVWALGYSNGGTNIGTPVLTWNASGNVGIDSNFSVDSSGDVTANGYVKTSFLNVIGRLQTTGTVTDGSDLSVTGNSTLSGSLTTYGGTTAFGGILTHGGIGVESQGSVWDFYSDGPSPSYFGGRVGIFTSPTNPYFSLQVNGSAFSTGNFTSGSDVRWKKDVTPLTDSLDKVMQLQGVNFYWKIDQYPDKKFPTGQQVGFIAQDVKKIIPQVVSTDPQGYESITYDKLTAVLAEAIKEQQKEIVSLQGEVDALQANK